MKINYTHAEGLCSAAEFSLLEQCKPKVLMKFSEEELKLKIKQAHKLAEKRAKGGAEPSKEVKGFFTEAEKRLESRLARKQKESPLPGSKGRRPHGFAQGGGAPSDPGTLSLKQRAKQNAIVSGQRIEASGADTRVKGHVAALGRRREAAREAVNG